MSRLYDRGGFYENSEAAQALVDIGSQCQWVAPLYAPFGYDRPQPKHLLSRDAEFIIDLGDQYREWNATYTRGSSTDLFVLEDGLLFNRSLYKAIDGEIVQMYETNRPGDRPWRPDLDPATDLREIKQPRNAASDFFYLGSIGSENYGHWLIDDLTRARSIIEHFTAGRVPTVVLNSYFPVIDAVREQTLRALTAGITEIEVIFLNYRCAYFFPRLFFVSPSSYHPFLKCPEGVRFLRDHFVANAAIIPPHSDGRRNAGGKHLFVTRRALWRNVINLAEVIAYFQALSFEIVELDGLSFLEQVSTFSQAEIVVGVMGAGMANVVFSPEDAAIVYLAPEGWKDPYFWDLAAVKKHSYSVVFGEPSAPQAPSFSSFRIDPAQLDIAQSWL